MPLVTGQHSFQRVSIASFSSSTSVMLLSGVWTCVGVEVGAAVKNVLAIATGVCDGLGLGHNARAALVTRGLAEMARLAEVLGGRRETLMGLAGMGVALHAKPSVQAECAVRVNHGDLSALLYLQGYRREEFLA